MKVSDLNGFEVDLLYVLLLYSGKYSYLPDLYDLLGKEQTTQLLDCFAGTTIAFPSIKKIRDLAHQISVYMRISKASKKQRPTVIQEIASEMQVHKDTVLRTYKNTAKILETDLQVEVILGGRGKQRRKTDPTREEG